MKKLLIFLLVLTAFAAKGQDYYNEWIDFTKPYYKFKVGATGLYRIPQSTLAAAGLGTVDAQDIQLWRNGVEVPVYTSVAAGLLSSADYVEFWGKMNDGKPDNNLYRNPAYQLNDKWSLETDTASYFLTVNNSGPNLRLSPAANNVAGNSLPAEPYFMYKTGVWFRSQMSGGYAVNVGSYMFSSSYDRGEGWTSSNIGTNSSLTTSLTNLFPYMGTAPAPRFNITVSGTANNPRRYKATINSDSVSGKSADYFNIVQDTVTFAQSLLSTGTAAVQVFNITTASSDRLVIHKYEITYARQFNFGGANNFEFTLPASPAGRFLQISNFNYGSVPPVLYDFTNNKRYVADISTPGTVKIVIEPSATESELVLVREEATNVSMITTVQQRTFKNYGIDSNQGDYLIITNPVLFNGPGGSNPVEEYRSYRASVDGGSYAAKTFLIEDLTDQFGYGIKMNPLAIRNFLQFARDNFNQPPKFVFIIGKAVEYIQHRIYESNSLMDRLDLVPSFGSPASDMMLSSMPGSSVPETPIGRLSVISGQELADYLNKIKQFELAQNTPSPFIVDKAWMKNVVHVVGSSEPVLQATLYAYMSVYKNIIQDTLFGGHVTTFAKQSSNPVDQINSSMLDSLFARGITLITYFGHSGSTTLEFNLNNPDQYNNTGKYPVFIALGCNAGNFYNFSSIRFTTKETLSESFVLAPNKGSIGFIASSHFGIPDYLHLYNQKIYESASVKNYGKSMGEILKSAIEDIFAYTTQDDFYARATCEETSLHGDPAIKLNPHPKPDYAIEPDLLEINPAFVSVADGFFNVKAKFVNLGMAINKNIVVEVKQENAAGLLRTIYRDTIPGIRYSDSINLNVLIDPIRDKGRNKLTITIDAENEVDEIFETNNTITKEFEIFEDEARPIYPYNFSIVGNQNIKFYASTTNPFTPVRTYQFEIDTTEKFNSPIKITSTQTSSGGILEFTPPVTFSDSTVYYWRVANIPASGSPNWTSLSSFIYLNGSEKGFNQSHYFQHLKSTLSKVRIDSATRLWKYENEVHNLFAKNTVFPTGGTTDGDFTVSIDGSPFIRSACLGYSLIFNVIDPVSGKAWKNVDASNNNLYLYGSAAANCGSGRQWNFEFSYMDATNRKKMMDFMDSLPNGAVVSVRNIPSGTVSQNKYAADWMADTSLFGSGNSLYHRLKAAGFMNVDSFNKPRAFIFFYKKNSNNLTPISAFTEGIYDHITLSADYTVPTYTGTIVSPAFGPAKAWKRLMWKATSLETPSTDQNELKLVGIKNDFTVDTLQTYTNLAQGDFDISFVNPLVYPYLKLVSFITDTVYRTPSQLKFWRIYYTPMAEGGVAPNILFTMKDTFDVGEPIDFKMAFKNISDAGFDSIKLKVTITDKNNITHVIDLPRMRPLAAGDTVQVHFPIDSRLYTGMNTLYVDVNPDNDQPEQLHFNNFIYKRFYVANDTLRPLLDVTFDNTHIINGDIVSSKPHIVIQLKDDAKWNRLNDTTLLTLEVRDPAGNTRSYHFDSDTLQFIPAQAGGENIATINFNPYFAADGDYELTVRAHDKSNNEAGTIAYRVGFTIINKPMISNMLNYPNPFTSSTAFVFTITGSEVPQNIRIQILTITGKIVREITKNELGPLRVGRNITEFKWDGTDQYGRMLGNGVYLYRVITNLDGKSLDKYTSPGEKTDKFFNKGYGKMYLMR
jgi:hypothetical protein